MEREIHTDISQVTCANSRNHQPDYYYYYCRLLPAFLSLRWAKLHLRWIIYRGQIYHLAGTNACDTSILCTTVYAWRCNGGDGDHEERLWCKDESVIEAEDRQPLLADGRIIKKWRRCGG